MEWLKLQNLSLWFLKMEISMNKDILVTNMLHWLKEHFVLQKQFISQDLFLENTHPIHMYACDDFLLYKISVYGVHGLYISHI